MGTTPNPKKINGHRTRYSRAFECSKRSDYWKNVTRKVEYEIEIIKENDDLEHIKAKEIELIAFYGRKKHGGGTLVNHDIGGTGGGAGTIKDRDLPIEQLDLDNNQIRTWKNPMEIERELGFLRTNIIKCCRKKQITGYGYKWNYLNGDQFCEIRPTTRRKNRIIKRQAKTEMSFMVWNKEEEQILLKCVKENGLMKGSEIAANLLNRTKLACVNHVFWTRKHTD